MALTTEERKELHAKIDTCTGIAFDTCHKIYVLMDEEEFEKMKGYGYEALIKAEYSTPSIMYSTVLHWYKNSCGLEFICATSSSADGAGTDFYTIAAQR